MFQEQLALAEHSAASLCDDEHLQGGGVGQAGYEGKVLDFGIHRNCPCGEDNEYHCSYCNQGN